MSQDLLKRLGLDKGNSPVLANAWMIPRVLKILEYAILEGYKMSNSEINCHVDGCQHHKNADECELKSVSVGQSKPQATDRACTECDSFEKK
jgi:hypothetical protein